MNQIRNYSKLAKEILVEIGGEDNLISFTRCATRLRLILKSVPENAIEKIKQMPGVITALYSGGQLQVVIGTHVTDLYESMSQLVDNSLLQAGENKKRIIDSIISTMSAVFAPIVYILAAAGILQGILIIINFFSISFNRTGTFGVLNFISWTPFAFLPVFIGITASKHFKCNPYIAVFCCCALINPDWAAMAAHISHGENLNFLYIPLAKTVYTSTVLPPLFLVWVLSWLEKRVDKFLPDVIKQLFTPLICVVIMVPLTLVLIGPITSGLAEGIAIGYNWLFSAAPAVAALIIGGFWQVIVIFGIHWGITPVIVANFKLYGHDSFQAFQTIAVVAQMAAAFACAAKSRQSSFKTMAYSAGVTGIFGITEPAIYGVTLRLKKPFICGCIGGAVGALVTSLFGSFYYAYAGLPSLLTTVNAINVHHPYSFIGEIVGVLIAVIVTFILVYIAGFSEFQLIEKEQDKLLISAETSTMEQDVSLNSPMSGTMIPLEQVRDQTFSEKLLGDGVAILPTTNTVLSPCDAEIVSIIDSQHAIGLRCDNHAELLIHIGIDTVNLKGQYFNVLVKVGQRVNVGTPLITFEKEKIEHEGYDLTTPILILNSDEFLLEPVAKFGIIESTQPIIMLKKQINS